MSFTRLSNVEYVFIQWSINLQVPAVSIHNFNTLFYYYSIWLFLFYTPSKLIIIINSLSLSLSLNLYFIKNCILNIDLYYYNFNSFYFNFYRNLLFNYFWKFLKNINSRTHYTIFKRCYFGKQWDYIYDLPLKSTGDPLSCDLLWNFCFVT